MSNFLVVWNNDNPSTYIFQCSSMEEVQNFLTLELKESSGEYGIFVIRQKDGFIAKIRDGKILEFEAAPLYK